MFDVGFWELVLIFALGLVVLGPEKLPKVAAQLGNWAGQARRMARILTSQLQEEIEKETRHPEYQPPTTPQPDYSRPGVEELQTNAPRPGESPAPAPGSARPPPGAGGSPG